VLRRSLHSILEELKVEKTGFHAMRRFRSTWLRKQRVPEHQILAWARKGFVHLFDKHMYFEN
jgi:hypothetical protein